MLPGISAEDCLFADLGVDRPKPAARATRRRGFLERRPTIEPTGGARALADRRRRHGEPLVRVHGTRLPELVERLRELYPDEHEVVVYEASSFVGVAPLIRPTPLAELAAAVTPASTLYVPPVEQP